MKLLRKIFAVSVAHLKKTLKHGYTEVTGMSKFYFVCLTLLATSVGVILAATALQNTSNSLPEQFPNAWMNTILICAPLGLICGFAGLTYDVRQAIRRRKGLSV